jgi:hypothetical protein
MSTWGVKRMAPKRLYLSFSLFFENALIPLTWEKWFARLGYYTIPSNTVEDCVDFFEDVFCVSKPKSENDQNDVMSSILGTTSGKKNRRMNGLRKVETNQDKGSGGKTNQQFKLVDAEEFSIGNAI